MGQDIETAGFREADFAAFRQRLELETRSLGQGFAEGRLSREGPRIGFELEAWLIDRNCFPAPHNQSFLARLRDPMVVSELSRFNIELNGPPQMLAGDGLLRLERGLAASWRRCIGTAHDDVDTVIAIGTLPTLRESDLSLANITPSNRYLALNAELGKARRGAPLRIDIDCADAQGAHLRTCHSDVMLEAATTSFQLHLQAPCDRLPALFNASLLLSAPLVAIAANSPFLFGQPLWHESRIPIFEQALEQAPPRTGESDHRRVTFGAGYLGDDPTAIFAENLRDYPVLLPVPPHEPVERYAALRLHNGTIWRWNRVLVGFDADGTPHLRLEHRIMPAGPSVIDMIANAAFYYGAVHMLAQVSRPGREGLSFASARANFYTAAKHGLDAQVIWLDGRIQPVRDVLAELLPLAREGLARQGVTAGLIDRYLDVIGLRLASGRTGAAWQLAHHARHGDLFRLTAEYLEHQRSGMAVHEWPL
ncbi:hypothetical protein [Novosphingobium album (ex Liu et al. 2023)]|uniref:Glutamate--cysteine ligase n=1 Tax=Novosphingobium album (ex Liu et al. 2023) TaxID=3031130 RepID=A0ABT5WNC4_9SPHN|nr:hypothetical protein [Novosphingobium album (ex Liu et al. 2023)]MDE8651541.1 hypothetical protein [Novosphingobium album (ex Liu et al. 2023)]